MKRSSSVILMLIVALVMAACGGAAQPTAAPTAAPTQEPVATTEAAPDSGAAATAEATAEATSGGISIQPANPTPQPTLPVAGTPVPGSSIGDKPIGDAPVFKPPKTIEELRAAYPDLGPFIDQYKDAAIGDVPAVELYAKIVAIFNTEGAAGVATFLEGSGLLEKMNIPLSYLDLLRAFDEGGAEAVVALAEKRKLINENDEIVGYLALDSEANLAAETARLNGIDVSVYNYLPETEEVEIGISVEVLSQFQTPGKMLEYIISIGNSPHVVGWRLPVPNVAQDDLNPQKSKGVGAATIGADKWHAAGITGKGIKIGVLDLGFGGVKSQLGKGLPKTVQTNISIDKMDRQKEDHGTAVAMVVNSVAPDAELYLAFFDGFSGGTGLIKALQWLESSGVQAINYSVGSTVGPRNGQFGDSVLFDAFTRETGIPIIVAAGNSADEHTLLKFTEGEENLHKFGEDKNGKAVYAMPFVAGSVYQIVMNWNGNWNGKEKSQYDFYVLDEDGEVACVGNEPRRGRKNDYPIQFQICEGDPEKVFFLIIQRTRGTTDNVLDIFIEPGQLVPWAQVPQFSVNVPADADGVLSVGAVGLTNDELEYYSSQGPTTDGRLKPDISAPTGEVVAGYADGFNGTSGAAPMVTGAAALLLQAFPEMTAGELFAYLTENVLDLGDKGEDVQFGTGRLQLPDAGGDGSIDGDNSGDDAGTTTEGVAVITDVRAKFGVKVKRQVGLQIKVSFELDNFEGKQMVVAALFYDSKGNAVESSDPDYDANGTIGVGTLVKPKRNQTAFKNVTLFIPDSAFEDVTEDELYFTVIAADATDKSNWVLVAQSEPIQIVIDR